MLERRNLEGRLGLGTAALGRPAYIALQHAADFRDRTPEAMERQAHAVLDAAYASGVRYVDAARSYGHAERFVRSWLDARGLSAGDVAVGSKWGYVYVGDWRVDAPVHERKEHSLAMFERQAAESTELLGAHLRLYQIHSATRESGVLEDGAVLDALARLKERSIAVGLTTSGPGQADTLRRAMEITRGGVRLFDAVQATWNVLEPSCEAALAEAKRAGMTILVKEVLANGRLTARGDAGEGSALARLASARGVTPDVVAIAAALSRAWADVVLIGPGTVAHLESNLRARELPLSADELGALAELREAPGHYWDTRSRLPWN